MTTFRKLALATTLTTIATIGAGALVRATSSGLGCPGWPRCFGRWIPPWRYHAIIEYSHRFIGFWAIVLLAVTTVIALARHRQDRRLLVPVLVALPMILMQAILGAIVVKTGLNPTLVTLHIGTAMVLIGVLVAVTVNSYCLGRPEKSPPDPRTTRLGALAASSVFALILIGAYVRGQGAGLAFGDWPLMDGQVIPPLHGHALTHFIHRAAALLVGMVLAVFVVRANRKPRDAAVAAFANIAGVLYIAQAVVGGLQVFTKLAAPPVVAHVVLSSLIWSSLIAATVVARHLRSQSPVPTIAESESESPRLVRTIKAYVQLTKPRIIALLVVTTVPTMLLAKKGWPSAWLMLATIGGGTLAAAAANTINMYFDQDIDARMRRTRARPLPAHLVAPRHALVFGVVLQATSFFFMAATVNLLAAMLTQAAVVFYVFVYTLGLKRSTSQNIVIGGAAGAVPVLVGWAAVTGRLGFPAVVLFAVIFFWTPAHFWALAMRYSDDYRAAGVPMMPVVAGARATQLQIAVYSVLTVAVTLLLFPIARMGTIYLIAAILLGALLIRHALMLLRSGTAAAAMGMFRFSISYLALLFAAMGLDVVVHLSA